MAEYEVQEDLFTFESGCLWDNSNPDVGDSLKVYYLPSDPGNAIIKTPWSRLLLDSDLGFAAILFLIAAIASALIALAIRLGLCCDCIWE